MVPDLWMVPLSFISGDGRSRISMATGGMLSASDFEHAQKSPRIFRPFLKPLFVAVKDNYPLRIP